jgi:hypothetical protein
VFSDKCGEYEYLEKKCKEKLGYHQNLVLFANDCLYSVDEKFDRICKRDNVSNNHKTEIYEKFLRDEAILRGRDDLITIANMQQKTRKCEEFIDDFKKIDPLWLDYEKRLKKAKEESFCNSQWYRPGVLIRVKRSYQFEQVEEIIKFLIGNITTSDEYGSCGNPYLWDNDFIVECKEVVSEEEMNCP